MAYDFKNLSYLDFEDLARDLVGQELSVRFEAFCPGPDDGMDGRFASPKGELLILQAKHYASSSFSMLKSEMKRARAIIDKLNAIRYLLVTSRGLTPPNKKKLADIIGPSLQNEADIFDATMLNDLLRRFPEIEKANVKLWLSSAAVLDRVVHAAQHTFTAITRAEIEAKVKVYASNPSFGEALAKLETSHVVIISGPPGVGKTTLAEMLAYAYIVENWEYVALRSLDDGFAKLQDTKKQIFFFDDFLGTAALDTKALAAKDTDLARFLKRIRNSPNARFVLTTRAPIFEEARRVSEKLADTSLDILKYVLDVGQYTRRIKARILHNHLVVSGISHDHIKALWTSGAIPKIVDHKNYSPRIVEAMTDGVQLKGVEVDDYPSAFIKALDNPQRIWDVSFRSHILQMCRHLLFALFFCSDYGASIDELRVAFNALHQRLCSKYKIAHDPKDFDESLRILESGYIAIRGRRVTFINPSLRDYLSDYIDDFDQLCDFAESAQKADWAERVWDHACDSNLMSPIKQKRLALSFLSIAERMSDLPESFPDYTLTGYWNFYELSYSERIGLLLNWHSASGETQFAVLALDMLSKRLVSFSPWRDGRRLLELILEIKNGEFGELHDAEDYIAKLETAVIQQLEGYVPPDDLEIMCDAIDEDRDEYGPKILDAADAAMRAQIENVDSVIEGEDSKSTLTDHISAIKIFGPRLGVPEDDIATSVRKIQRRIDELDEEVEEASSPSLSSTPTTENEIFDSVALANLFAPLVRGIK